MRLQIDSYLPRSNSINRSYFKVKLDVLKDIRFQECALFQLGSDYYNELDAQQVAWGHGNTLTGQARPRAAGWGRVIEPVQLKGEQPWVSLYNNNSETKTVGHAGRGFVVRDYVAKLDGKIYESPWMVATRNQTRLNTELLPDPKVLEFKAGDSIEFTVEMDVFPISADVYCGTDEALKARLAATPDSWELTAFEAVHQGVSINGTDTVYPATLAYDGAQRQQFKLSSRSGMDTICVTGLPKPDGWRIGEWIDGAFVELGTRFAVEAAPQIVYLPESNSWTVVLSLVFPEGNSERTLVVEVQ